MKRFFVLFLIAVTFLMGESYAKRVVFKNGSMGGIVGKDAIFIYDDKGVSEIKDKDKLSLLSKLAKKQVCSNKTLRDGVEKLDLDIIYIYTTKELKEATIVVVEDCK